MDSIKKLFPLSFTKKEDVKSLVIMVVVHIVAMILLSAVMGIIGWVLKFIPLVGTLLGIVGALADLYLLVGLVFVFLNYFKVGDFKD